LRLILLLCILLVPFGSRAQTLYGVVLDGENHKPVYPVSIIDLANGHATTTDDQGYFTLPVHTGDMLSFSFIQFHTEQRLAYPDSFLRVELFPLSIALQEFILHPDYTPFQKDSAEMATLYSKDLNVKRIKPSLGGGPSDGFGVSASGLIGSLAQKVSRSYKRDKKFKKQFELDMEQKYIDSRYVPGLVTALTGLTGDTLAVFMNTYPMDYNFARTSTDLDIKMWVRNNYRDYLEKGNMQPIPVLKTK